MTAPPGVVKTLSVSRTTRPRVDIAFADLAKAARADVAFADFAKAARADVGPARLLWPGAGPRRGEPARHVPAAGSAA